MGRLDLIEFMVETPRGCYLMVNNQKFHKKRTKGSKIEWRCSKRRSLGCKAAVFTYKQDIVKRTASHNHD